MCGVLGWIDPSLTDREAAVRMTEPALDALRDRGPDDHRLECGPGWILGHTRLSIIDLSSRSSQPMTIGQGRWLVYNGEIYNFRELRAELASHGTKFESDGDAEVLLHALGEWGVSCLERLRGMFAFALVDVERRELLLARDRYGVKPLAYEVTESGIRFASNLRALGALPNASHDIDHEAAYLFMSLGYIPAPHAIYRRVRKVRPGHYLSVRWSDAGIHDIKEEAYWRADSLNGMSHTGGDLLDEFEARVADAVRSRLVSDVPVGSLLSGGIDSTLVTGFARDISAEPVTAFTMGFDDPEFDEAPAAREIAKELGGNHREFRMTHDDVDGAFDRMISAYDEPFADSSAIPMIELSRQVASEVKVALTGDGGDETGCGYDWHHRLNELESSSQRLHRFRMWHRMTDDRAVDRAGIWTMMRTGLSDEMLGILPLAHDGARKPLSEYFRDWSRDLAHVDDAYLWAGAMDLLTYVPDDLMVKADRASMSTGLELREPLLDHRLTAWLLQTPLAARFDAVTASSKLLPRRALIRRISPDLVNRPKRGFTPPLAGWLAGPLAGRMQHAMDRLEKMELDPIVLPRGCATWRDLDPVILDSNNQFLWRILCFSEWTKHAGAH